MHKFNFYAQGLVHPNNINMLTVLADISMWGCPLRYLTNPPLEKRF